MARKRKSLYTVKEATAMAFERMNETFEGPAFITMVRALLARPHAYDATILRRLRELRDENPKKYGYEVIDFENSRYKKRKLQPVHA